MKSSLSPPKSVAADFDDSSGHRRRLNANRERAKTERRSEGRAAVRWREDYAVFIECLREGLASGRSIAARITSIS